LELSFVELEVLDTGGFVSMNGLVTVVLEEINDSFTPAETAVVELETLFTDGVCISDLVFAFLIITVEDVDLF